MSTQRLFNKTSGYYNFSYTSPHDSPLKRWVIGGVEMLTGKQLLQKKYNELHVENASPTDVWGRVLSKLSIKLDFDPEQLEKFPKTGPVIFIANHPFGIVDGVAICHIVTRVRKDYFLLVNEVMADEPIVHHHLLPVDFRENQEAMQINLHSRQEARKRLSAGEALIIFPSGGVATAKRGLGKAEEFPWKRFIAPLIHQTRCPVVPMYFHGQNSRIFHLASGLSMNIRLGLLLNEIRNKQGKTIRVNIGEPISYEKMESIKKRQELIDFLYRETLKLGE